MSDVKSQLYCDYLAATVKRDCNASCEASLHALRVSGEAFLQNLSMSFAAELAFTLHWAVMSCECCECLPVLHVAEVMSQV